MNFRTIELHGHKVELWEATCACGFVTGLARVYAPDGSGILFSGAGCFDTPRRGPDEVMEKVEKWIEVNNGSP